MLKESASQRFCVHRGPRVLILILMEYVQRVLYMCYFITVSSCLNPYFNGTCSKSFARKRNTYQRNRLNPYFNGTCSKSQHENSFLPSRFDVLILILMEHAQRGTEYKNPWSNNAEVLILILMEHAQRVWLSNAEAQRYLGLNPYFNGTCSKSQGGKACGYGWAVLILILMEHAQRGP